MSSQRVLKIFQGMPEQLKKLGPYTFNINDVIRWQGRVTAGADAGKDACVIDLTAATWANGNLRAIIVADAASDLGNTAAMKTQSHASGMFIDGSVRFRVYVETPEDHVGNQARFVRILMHHLVGQLGAPVELYMGTNDVEPTRNSVNGAGADSASATAGWYLPWGMTYPGGI